MEINVEIKNLTQLDIIYILSEGFKCPMWYKNDVIEVTNKLLNNEKVKNIVNTYIQEFYVENGFAFLYSN